MSNIINVPRIGSKVSAIVYKIIAYMIKYVK